MGVGSGQRQFPDALSPGKEPLPAETGRWVGPRAGLDGRAKTRPCPDSISGPYSLYKNSTDAVQNTRPVLQAVACHTTGQFLKPFSVLRYSCDVWRECVTIYVLVERSNF
jgi:hypothetical protein